ncbi:MAG: hypothetical protein WCR40_01770 [Candidatus Paceibacterota bacterium]|nr:hypothetical protein [Candidatus Paceibacterota bacterium]
MNEGAPKIDNMDELKETQWIDRMPITIKKPEDSELLSRLEEKLKEYESRLESVRSIYEANPRDENINSKYHDALYKFVILGTLLNEGSADETKILHELSDLHKGVNTGAFDRALKVIKAYVEGGNVVGGTGLKK